MVVCSRDDSSHAGSGELVVIGNSLYYTEVAARSIVDLGRKIVTEVEFRQNAGFSTEVRFGNVLQALKSYG